MYREIQRRLRRLMTMKKRTHDLIVDVCGLCAVLTLTVFIVYITVDALSMGYVR